MFKYFNLKLNNRNAILIKNRCFFFSYVKLIYGFKIETALFFMNSR
jgi:hypothetical protein